MPHGQHRCFTDSRPISWRMVSAYECNRCFVGIITLFRCCIAIVLPHIQYPKFLAHECNSCLVGLLTMFRCFIAVVISHGQYPKGTSRFTNAAVASSVQLRCSLVASLLPCLRDNSCFVGLITLFHCCIFVVMLFWQLPKGRLRFTNATIASLV